MNYEKSLAHKIDFASGWVVCKLGALCLYSSQDQGGSYVDHHPRTQSGKALEVIVTNETDKLEVKN